MATVGPWAAAARAATEDELAFANFGAPTELLLKDFYAKALDARTLTGPRAGALKRGRSAAAQSAGSGRSAVQPFPVATDLETASNALEAYLG